MKKEQKIMIGVLVGVVILAILIFFLLKGCVKEYTITFDSNGGTSVEPIKVKEKEKVPKPNDPTKEGYIFAGWYYEDELFDFETLVTKDMTLEAYWSSNGIELKTNTLSMVIGSEQKIEVTSLPDGVKKEDLVYLSSDESIVTVDKDGNVKALKAGKVTITIQTKDGKYKTTCTVTVTEEKIEVKSVSITGSSTVTVGSSIKLSVTLNPSDATNEKLTWTSSDTSIATVDENGRVKGLKAGTVTITVTTENGKTATREITVKEKSTTPSNPSTPSEPSNPTPSTPTPNDPEEDTPTPSEPTVPKKYTITFDSNGGTSVSSQTVEEGGVVKRPSDPTKTGYTFVEWQWNGKTFDFQTKIRENITLKAVWKENEPKYVITLTANVSDTGSIRDYTITSVTKDGKDFKDFITFTYNNQTRKPVHIGKVMSADFIDKGITSATIVLENGTKVTATVVIK